MRELACFALREPDDTACNFSARSQPHTALPTLDLRMLADIVVIFSFVEAHGSPKDRKWAMQLPNPVSLEVLCITAELSLDLLTITDTSIIYVKVGMALFHTKGIVDGPSGLKPMFQVAKLVDLEGMLLRGESRELSDHSQEVIRLLRECDSSTRMRVAEVVEPAGGSNLLIWGHIVLPVSVNWLRCPHSDISWPFG